MASVQPLPWASGSTAALAATLTAWIGEASLCDTEGERCFGDRLVATVCSLPYFRQHADQVAVLPTRGQWQPPVIAAWVRGQRAARSPRPVVVITGHYDTVGVDDLLAYGVDPFDARAVARHFAVHAADPDVRRDAASGEYLFGRGGLDMKAGLVASLAALEELARRADELPGDVIWIAAPDEENLSRGAVRAREWLYQWLEQQGGVCVGLINTDYVPGRPRGAGDPDGPSAPDDPNAPGSVPVYFGAIGKLLPSFLVSGLTAHVGDPLAGLDPITVAAELVRQVSLDPGLREDETTPPPVPLRLRDLKEAYSVQTAPAAAGYFNFYFARRPVRQIMERLVRAGEAAVRRIAERYRAYGRTLPDVPVLLLSDLPADRAAAPSGGGEAATVQPGAEAAAAPSGSGEASAAHREPREQARERVMRRLEAAGGPRPSIVWYIGPGCWAPVPDPDQLDGGRLRRAVFAAAAAVGCSLRDAGPYPFISDMSVFGGLIDAEDHRFIRAQFPGQLPADGSGGPDQTCEVGGLDTLPPAGRPALPCVNLGPCGEGPHSPYERVHIGYSLGTLPRLLVETVRRVLAGQAGS